MPHSINHGDACFAYFNKIRGIPTVHSLAMDDRCLAATTEQWDADPWLLNTPDGVVNLRTGKLREHRPEDYMTAITAVSPGGKCPLWHKFIARVTNDDASLAEFLQWMCGYALTGLTIEQAFFCTG
jgi:putative DNA primase/helicase